MSTADNNTEFDFKKLAQGPWLWIAAGALIVGLGFAAMFAGGGTQRIDTYQGIALLHSDMVKSAVMVDGDQRVQLELTEDFITGGDNPTVLPDVPQATAVTPADAASPEATGTPEADASPEATAAADATASPETGASPDATDPAESPAASPSPESSPAASPTASPTGSATEGDDKPEPERNRGKDVEFFYTAPQGLMVADTLRSAQAEGRLPEGFNSEVPQTSVLSSILGLVVPFLLIAVVFWFLMSRMQGGSNRVMGFGKSRAKLINKDMPQVTFADVAGVDEAVEELHEIKEFLQEPAKFQAVGARIPKGVLLYGPPGTGKTLLARAVAGEAGVPFYSISGSDFVEMFVGVGASRVRDLFDQAKQNSPAIIFVDEIDAVGRHRGAGMGGGHDEREQTLNQLLVEMDGFDVKTNVILIAATNRPDILDPALLRPGRFDRQVAVEAPDLKGREAILKVHAKGKPMVPSVDLESVARRTPGFTGADLANVLNEAALLTARSGAQLIDDRALDEAIDRVIAGPQKRTRIMNPAEVKNTAYHEGGHALVAAAMNNTDPVTKVTILPRGRALGYTMVMPTEDKYSTTRNELLDQLAYAMGGRVAEEVVFHDPTTGASNDIEKATNIARKMVTEYGMSDKVGAVKFGSGSSEPFMGRDYGTGREYSEAVATMIDDEVRALVESAHDEAWQVITKNRDVLDNLVVQLLAKETLSQSELAEVFKDVVKQAPRDVWLSSEDRPVHERGPVDAPTAAEVATAAEAAASEASTAASTGADSAVPAAGTAEGNPAQSNPAESNPTDAGAAGSGAATSGNES